MCFSPFKDAEIDLTVLRVESEVAQEDFDKKQKEREHQKPITPQSPAHQSPLVRRPDEIVNFIRSEDQQTHRNEK